MLVVDPAKRITIAQIWQHRWVQADPALLREAHAARTLCSYDSSLGDYDEQVLGVMRNLGIDRQRTLEVSGPWARGQLPPPCRCAPAACRVGGHT